jgi:hypothetical protein
MVSNKLPKEAFFFIGISFKLFWFSLLAIFFNWRIYVFDTGKHHITFTLLQKMHKRNWITRVTEYHCISKHTNSDAIRLVNHMIDKGSYDIIIQLVQELCESTEVALVFKKALVQHLFLLISINQYISWQHEYSFTLFVSKKYYKVLQNHTEILDPSIVVNYGFYWGKIKLWIKWIVVVFGYLLHLLVQPFRKKRSTSEKAFKFAISIPFPWATKFKGAREFTFLVDDKTIKKDETVFLVEYPESKEFYQYYSDAGYTLKEALGFQKASNLFKASTLKFHHDFFIVIKLLFACKKDFFIYEALVSLFFHRISWSVIVAKSSFENYIYFNKEGKSQISTNIFLKEQGITTYAYSQFIGGSYQVCGKNSIFDRRNIYWSFINPDYFYLNNQAMADSLLLHYQDTVQHRVIGNIFSEKIIEMKKDTVYIENIKKQHCIGDSQQVISIFDTSYVESRKLYSTYNEAQYFLKDVIRSMIFSENILPITLC